MFPSFINMATIGSTHINKLTFRKISTVICVLFYIITVLNDVFTITLTFCPQWDAISLNLWNKDSYMYRPWFATHYLHFLFVAMHMTDWRVHSLKHKCIEGDRSNFGITFTAVHVLPLYEKCVKSHFIVHQLIHCQISNSRYINLWPRYLAPKDELCFIFSTNSHWPMLRSLAALKSWFCTKRMKGDPVSYNNKDCNIICRTR